MIAAFASCKTRRARHYDICTTLRISTSNYSEESEAEHHGIELCYTNGGSHYYRRIRGQSTHLIAGKLMVLNGLEKHVEECSKNPTIPEIRAVIIEPRFITDLLSEADLDAEELLFDPLMIPLQPSMQGLLDDLFSFKEAPGISRVAFDCLLTELVADIVLTVRNTYSGRLRSLLKTGHFPAHFARAKKIIREHASREDASLEGLARVVGLSKFHFVRSFKENTGMSPMRYMQQLRIDLTKRRLAATPAPIAAIAAETGYADLSTFNKAFKRLTGEPPSRFRERFSSIRHWSGHESNVRRQFRRRPPRAQARAQVPTSG